MTQEEWQRRRGVWMEKERAERSTNWQQARGNVQVAITEQAVRELYDRIEVLEEASRPKVSKEK